MTATEWRGRLDEVDDDLPIERVGDDHRRVGRDRALASCGCSSRSRQ